MAYIAYEALAVTATSSGSIATNSAKTYNGFVHCVRYLPTTSSTALTPSTGGSIDITAAVSGLAVLSLDDTSTAKAGTYYPRNATVTSTGATSTGNALIPLYNERFVVTMTSGSTKADTATALLHFYVS